MTKCLSFQFSGFEPLYTVFLKGNSFYNHYCNRTAYYMDLVISKYFLEEGTHNLTNIQPVNFLLAQ